MVKGYTTSVVSRIIEGSSYDDIENGDGLEEIYLVYGPEGELIWDTNNYELVEHYFDDELRDPKTVEEVKELIDTDPESLCLCNGSDYRGDFVEFYHYDEMYNKYTILEFSGASLDKNKELIEELTSSLYSAWDNLPIEEIENPEYIPHACSGDYSPNDPWSAPGMKVSDFYDGPIRD